MSETPVTTERVGRVGLIAIDNPPVNAASHAVRAGIAAAIDALAADDAVDVIALYGAGRTFIAGADIREFGKPPQEPGLSAVCTHIEACAKPVAVLIHGTTLGGGLEVALGCHTRVALPGTKIGFPEVTLGLIPGAGGTQRAPRLAGITAAVDLITSGKRIDAAEALALGLVDAIGDGTPREAAIRAGEDVLSGALPHRRTGTLSVAADEPALEARTAELKKKQPHLLAPLKCVEAVAGAARLSITDGLALERRLFTACLESPQRAGLVHAFFAERAVSKIPEAGATPRKIANVGVIGGGTMGSGIATAFLLAGYTVTMLERDAAALSRGQATVTKNLAGAQKRGKLSDARRAEIDAGAFSGTTAVTAFADADLVIEAAFEDMDVKKDLFGQLDAVAKDGAILATNTSYLDVNAIAAVTRRPRDVIGLHFFSPAHVMRLLEVVVADETADDVVATGFAVARTLGKVAVRAGVCEGFIGNRILTHYRKAAEYLVMDGASPAQVDRALEDFGFAMGPHAVFDLAGLDISWAARKRLAPTRPAEERYVAIADRLCEAGEFGRKTGRGFYLYGDDIAGRPENPDALAIIADEREKAGITPRAFTDAQIVERYIAAMIAEAARVVEDGTALRPIDVDAVLLFGYGFPRFRGGPLFLADTIGAATLVERIETYAQEDAHYWQVPDLLRTLAAEGRTFQSLNG